MARFLVLLTLSLSLLVSSSFSYPGKAVTGSGCVRSGAEAGCFILKDFKTKTTYNLFFKDTPPDLDTAISFEGVKHDGPTSCMQGTPVDISKWTQLKMHCSKPPKADSMGGKQ